MRRNLTAVIFVALAAQAAQLGAASASPGVENVIARHLAAQGGVERLKALKSVTTTATESFDGKTTTYASTRARPNLMRTEITEGDTVAVKAFDGKVGWFAKGGALEMIPEEKLAGMRAKAEFDDPLLDPAARGVKVELIGDEKVDGSNAFVLKLTFSNGDTQKRYIDTKSYLEVRRVATWTYEGKTMEKSLAFHDFKTVNGITTAMSATVEKDGKRGTWTVNKIEYDAPVRMALFSPPAMPKAGRAEALPASTK